MSPNDTFVIEDKGVIGTADTHCQVSKGNSDHAQRKHFQKPKTGHFVNVFPRLFRVANKTQNKRISHHCAMEARREGEKSGGQLETYTRKCGRNKLFKTNLP